MYYVLDATTTSNSREVTTVQQYYCLDCQQLHEKGSFEKEVVFSTGYFVVKEISYLAGYCSWDKESPTN
ncbi:DUF3973 domain-containing protein [Paenibacillus silviterrae]|uniref:DUF3973 domain-containing protein n=1 Tax=Paenibacillus silviterrae TaxID=3242194 RepID=UPI00350E5580